MKNFLNVHSNQSNSFVATAFGIAMTVLLFGGYEATHSGAAATNGETIVSQAAPAATIARMEPIIVTARRS